MKESSSESYEIHLRVGDKYQLKLEGPGSTGYTWEHAVERSPGIVGVLIEQLGEPPRSPRGGPIPSTYSLDKLAVVTALKPGRACIRLVLRRPWERDIPPSREIFLDIVVSE